MSLSFFCLSSVFRLFLSLIGVGVAAACSGSFGWHGAHVSCLVYASFRDLLVVYVVDTCAMNAREPGDSASLKVALQVSRTKIGSDDFMQMRLFFFLASCSFFALAARHQSGSHEFDPGITFFSSSLSESKIQWFPDSVTAFGRCGSFAEVSTLFGRKP